MNKRQATKSAGGAAWRQALREGLRDGAPIGLGYLAVSFSLGIAAKNAGMTAFEGFLASALCNASAGEYAGFRLIMENAAYLEVALMMVIANARYLLMSCAMSQRFSPDAPFRHRLFAAFYLTDEIFGASMARPGDLDHNYLCGLALAAAPCWAAGTALGALAGSVLPARLVSALSVALYGMFLAVIVPPARKNRVIAGLIALCFLASYGASVLPGLSALSDGMRTILLTIVLASGAALLFPPKELDDAPEGDGQGAERFENEGRKRA